MRTFLACLAVLQLAVPGTATALAISTGEDLQKTCQAAEQFTRCVGYLELVYRTARAAARLSELTASIIRSDSARSRPSE